MTITALMAPADAPEIPVISSRPSASRWSSTPQVKAPCAPPPCKARLIFFVFVILGWDFVAPTVFQIAILSR
jgi:hypothetical protein